MRLISLSDSLQTNDLEQRANARDHHRPATALTGVLKDTPLMSAVALILWLLALGLRRY